MSIGYNPTPSAVKWVSKGGGQMVRSIGDLDLGEYSFSAMPANASARVLSVKDLTSGEADDPEEVLWRWRTALAIANARELFG